MLTMTTSKSITSEYHLLLVLLEQGLVQLRVLVLEQLLQVPQLLLALVLLQVQVLLLELLLQLVQLLQVQLALDLGDLQDVALELQLHLEPQLVAVHVALDLQLLVLQDVELLDEVLPASVPLDPQVSLVLARDLSVLVRQEELLQPLLLLLLLAWQPPLLPGSLPSPHPQRPSWLRRN